RGAGLGGEPAGAEAQVSLAVDVGQAGPLEYVVKATAVAEADGAAVSFEAEPNDRYQDANPMILGRTVYGLADDRPYLPLGEAPTPAEASAGRDWFTFELTS